MDVFAPARELYAAIGFTRCEPFGEYTENPYSVCMTLRGPEKCSEMRDLDDE